MALALVDHIPSKLKAIVSARTVSFSQDQIIAGVILFWHDFDVIKIA